MVKVVTPEEFLKNLPKEVSLEEAPRVEYIDLKGKIKWAGHTHQEDLDNIVKALKEVFEFEMKEKSKKEFEEFTEDIRRLEIEQKLETEVEMDGKTSRITLEGMHPIGDVDFFWNIKGDFIKELYKAGQIYEEIARNKDNSFTFVYGKTGEWNFGARWKAGEEIEKFLSNEKGTLFYREEGNRDQFRYESRIPSSRFIFTFPTSKEEYEEILDKLWKGYEEIKDEVLFYNTEIAHSKQFWREKKRHFNLKINFSFSDLDFDKYIPIKSPISLAEKYQKSLENLDQGKVVDYPANKG